MTGKVWAAALLISGALTGQKPEAAESILQTAIKKDVVDGNLIGAIEGYRKAFTAAKADRPLAAKALVHMAECYQKMGNAESRKIYEQIVREYGDQKEAVAAARARLNRSSQPGRPTTTLVWKGDNASAGGRITPDGRYISFVDWSTGNLALHDTASGQDRVLAESRNPKGVNNVFAEESVISRDGKQIVYNWYDRSIGRFDLRILNLTGEPNQRLLYSNPNKGWLAPRDWSPDGKWIAVYMGTPDGTNHIGVVSVVDGSWRALKSAKWHGDGAMFFSPDSKYVGYDLPQGETTGGPRDVYVIGIDGTGENPAVIHRSHDFMMGWSPDGKRLLFGSDRTGSAGLWSLPFLNGRAIGTPEMIKPDIGFAESMGITRSGALYYGTSGGSTRAGGSILVASFDARSGAISSPRDVSQNYQENNMNPWWSPDGKYLAYVSERSSSGAGVVFVIQSADTGRTVRELPAKLNGLAGWSPDGRALLGVGRDDKGRSGSFRIDVETGETTLLFGHPSITTLHWPVWDTDGRGVYYVSRVPGKPDVIFRHRDLASGSEKDLIRKPSLGGIGLSPDGRYVATSGVDNLTGSRVILLIPTSGGEPRELMRVPADVPSGDLADNTKGQRIGAATWMPDSRSLIVRKSLAGAEEAELWQVPIDGGTPRKLDSPLKGRILAFKLSPDGRQVAYRFQETGPRPGPEIWALESFLPATGSK